jgi:hypothetical protein
LRKERTLTVINCLGRFSPIAAIGAAWQTLFLSYLV